MKVLDPFAGYRLASGHPIFHLSLFICSFFAERISKHQASESIQTSFWVLRWAHCLLFSLAIVSEWAKMDSDLDEKDQSVKISVEEVAFEKAKSRHRDGVYKLASRVFDTISVFTYQGAIFFV